MKTSNNLDAQLSKSYDYITAIFIAQQPRIPSSYECYGDGSIHGYNKEVFINVYAIILELASKLNK